MEGLFGIGAGFGFWLGFAAHAVDGDRPFISETGYRSFLGVHAEPVADMTPERFAAEVVATHIRRELKGRLLAIQPRSLASVPDICIVRNKKERIHDHADREDLRQPEPGLCLLQQGAVPGPDAALPHHHAAQPEGLCYFAGGRFGTRDGQEVTDEIALNPSHFRHRTTEQSLSTLVHEMTHLEQHHFGKPSRCARRFG